MEPESKLTRTRRASVIIVQPYVPKYREAFFRGLIETLDNENISCKVAAAKPTGTQAQRSDSTDADWIVPYEARKLQIGGRTLTLGGARSLWAGADGVIVGHLGSSLDTYLALIDSRRGRLKTGVWGHIKPYVSDGNYLDLLLEKWQLRNADQIFAYTPGGFNFAVKAGAKSEKVTTVMNSTDTELLERARRRLDLGSAHGFMSRHGLVHGKTVAYIGGLDSSKRIEFLSAALDQLWMSDPDIRIIVGGVGSQSALLRLAEERGQALLMGYVDADAQALIGHVASALLIPGRIGLVAVDALVLEIPILTTDWRYHAPEAEHLTEGESRFTSEDNVFAYVELVRRFMHHTLGACGAPRSGRWNYPTMTDMVANFSSGVLRMLNR